MRKLEVIALNIKDVENIQASFADRIELCIEINEDGLTPSKEMIEECLKISKVEINVMVRDENTFILTKESKESMLKMIKWLSKLKNKYNMLNGVVIGYITDDNKLDENFLKEVNNVKGELKVVFHKASDRLIDNNEILKLKNYNIDTILTQGGLKPICDNIEDINKLKLEFPNVEILLGGGVNKDNIDNLLQLGTSIHLGSAARINNDFNNDFNVEFLKEIKSKI